jgi:uncharacterized small protein (DUF1192 family)
VTHAERHPIDPNLDAELRALTTWTGPATSTWETALEASAARRPRFRVSFPPSARTIRAALAGLVACTCVAFAVMAVLPNVRGAPRVATQAPSAAAMQESRVATPPAASAFRSGAVDAEGLGGGHGGGGFAMPGRRSPSGAAGFGSTPGDGTSTAGEMLDVSADPDRDVVRTAMLELETPDVRDLFTKISALPVTADGEFVADARFDAASDPTPGELRRDATATVVLRVRSERLAAVLDQLRALGAVVSERVTGQDVTAQLADLSKRRGAEESAERDLRDLLASNDQAKLKDIVELRDRLSALQASVERIRAETLRVERLVSLATVTVSIRTAKKAAEAAPVVAPPTAGERFRAAVAQAWTDGIAGLGSSIAFLVAVAVGGLPWWIALAIGALAFKRAWQRRIEAGLA